MMNACTIAWCPFCDQGRIQIVKDTVTSKMLLLCEECDTIWDDPRDIEGNRVSNYQGQNRVIPPSMEELIQIGWSQWVTEKYTYIHWMDASLAEIRNSILFDTYFASVQAERIADKYVFKNEAAGVYMFVRDDHSIRAIQFFSGFNGENARFPGNLPYGLDFSRSRADTRKRFGKPCDSGSDWDGYTFRVYSLHFQYAADLQTINFITLSGSQPY